MSNECLPGSFMDAQHTPDARCMKAPARQEQNAVDLCAVERYV
ncbi:MAG: hypothetical protein AAF564_12305 [Bacteroidota bacterium]